MATNRVTGVAVEVLTKGTANPNAKVTGVTIEVLASVSAAPPPTVATRSFGIIII